MKSNPYHNSIHCADVVRSMHILITRGGMSEYMGDLDILASIIGAVVHDFEHLGMNNDLLIKMAHE